MTVKPLPLPPPSSSLQAAVPRGGDGRGQGPLEALLLLRQREPEDGAQPLQWAGGGVLQAALHVPVHGALLRGRWHSLCG